MKVLAIGFNRCGTQSLHKMFLDNGYESIHWNWGKAEDTMKENHKLGIPLLTGYESATLFSDIEFLTRHFILFAEQYPKAKFIYNYREVEGWIKSRKNLFKTNGWVIDEAYWRGDWKHHKLMVKEYFTGERKNRLLEFDIEKDSGEKIANFLPELVITQKHYPSVDWL